jgi:glycosyltransferase involved in cell wall biosynthesis
MSDDLQELQDRHEPTWAPSYPRFCSLIQRYNLRVGAEVGVAFGGHAEAILSTTKVQRLYGIDSYQNKPTYQDPMNLPQPLFDELYRRTKTRLSGFGERFVLVRADSTDAAKEVPNSLDFVFLDADHSYENVFTDLCTWFPKVREGGILSGHDYGHPNFPGIAQAVNRFFGRFSWAIHEEGETVWWVEKKQIPVTFIIPAFNCASTIRESVESILAGNQEDSDEIVVVDDGSTDGTDEILVDLQKHTHNFRVVFHSRNRGGGAARNTAVEAAAGPLLFCLDSDNVLAESSIGRLRTFLVTSGTDVATFQEVRYFRNTKNEVTHTWTLPAGFVALEDLLSKQQVPSAGGNYLFTRESWERAGGYPEFAGAVDTWGFGFRQLATGSTMMVMPDSHYYHRYGHDSYWLREARKTPASLAALQVVLPFLHLIEEKSADYIMGRKGRNTWLENLPKHPLWLKRPSASGISSSGTTRSLKRRAKATLRRLLTIVSR